MFIKNKNIKIKCKIDGKVNLYSRCFDCGFKKVELFIRNFNLIIKQCCLTV